MPDQPTSNDAIVIPKSPTPAEEFARSELLRYLPTERPCSIMMAQDIDRLAELTSVTCTLPQAGNDSYSIGKSGEHIYIVGNRPRALLQAVYAYLDQLGCRWLAPEFDFYMGNAQVTRLNAASSTQPLVTQSTAGLKYRKLYVEEGLSHTEDNLVQIIDWMPRVGYNTLVVPTDYQGTGRVQWDRWRQRLTPELQKRGLIIEVGGHGYQNFLNARMEGGRLFEAHPEWFGQDAKGTRRRERSYVFCTSNAHAVDYVTSAVSQYLLARPEIKIFDFWPPDSAKWCACAECEKLGTPATRQALLIQKVLPAIKQVRPDVILEVLAYSDFLQPPSSEHPLPAEVLVDFCPISQNFEFQFADAASPKNSYYREILEQWPAAFSGDISIYTYYRKYAWDSLPVQLPFYMQRDLHYFMSVPVQGISTYAEPADWASYELNHYVLGAIAWNPAADATILVKKFCRARYGTAAKEAELLLICLGDELRMFGLLPGTSLKPASEIASAIQRILSAAQNIEAAKNKLAANSAEEAAVDRLQLMTRYAVGDLTLRRLLSANASEEEIREKARELHGFLSTCEGKGLFLFGKRMPLERFTAQYLKRE